MTGTNHALTGAAIGIALQEPLLVIPAAFVSHFILDAIPHFDHEVYRFGSRWAIYIYAADGLVACSTVLALVLLMPWLTLPILLGAIFAVLPDATLPFYYLRGRPNHWLFKYHLGIQWYERPPGLLVEASYLIFISTALMALNYIYR